jgi:hypothetical protein
MTARVHTSHRTSKVAPPHKAAHSAESAQPKVRAINMETKKLSKTDVLTPADIAALTPETYAQLTPAQQHAAIDGGYGGAQSDTVTPPATSPGFKSGTAQPEARSKEDLARIQAAPPDKIKVGDTTMVKEAAAGDRYVREVNGGLVPNAPTHDIPPRDAQRADTSRLVGTTGAALTPAQFAALSPAQRLSAQQQAGMTAAQIDAQNKRMTEAPRTSAK